ARAQTWGGKASDAMATIDRLRKLPAAHRDDLRLDLAEAQAARNLSDFNRQRDVSARAVEEGEKQGARFLVAKARMSYGIALRQLGDPKGAIAQCELARKVSAQAGDRNGEAVALNSIGNALYDLGDLEGARKMYQQAVDINRQIGNMSALAGSL